MQDEQKIYYLVLVMRRWSSLSIGYGPLTIGDAPSPDGSAYYLSVYETREEAERAHPDCDIAEVRGLNSVPLASAAD